MEPVKSEEWFWWIIFVTWTMCILKTRMYFCWHQQNLIPKSFSSEISCIRWFVKVYRDLPPMENFFQGHPVLLESVYFIDCFVKETLLFYMMIKSIQQSPNDSTLCGQDKLKVYSYSNFFLYMQETSRVNKILFKYFGHVDYSLKDIRRELKDRNQHVSKKWTVSQHMRSLAHILEKEEKGKQKQ